jgi:hypothetical protein
MDFLILKPPLKSSYGIMVKLSRLTIHENNLSYKLDAKANLFEYVSDSFSGLSINVLPTSRVLMVKALIRSSASI